MEGTQVQARFQRLVVELVVGETIEVAGWGWVTPVPCWGREGYRMRASNPVPEGLARKVAAIVAVVPDAEAALYVIREVFSQRERAALYAE